MCRFWNFFPYSVTFNYFYIKIFRRILRIESFKMKFSEKSIMTFAGSIRGAIAFGLAISIDSKNKKIKQVLVSSTLVLVFITTILFGGLMPIVIKFFKGFEPKTEESKPLIEEDHENEEEEEAKLVEFSHPNFKKR